MAISREIVSEINRILGAIRAGLDAGSYPADIARDNNEIVRRLYLKFEEIRFSFRLRANTSRSRQSYYGNELIRALQDVLIDFRSDPDIAITETVRFRPLNMARPSTGFSLHPGLMEPRISILTALNYLIEGLDHTDRQKDLFPPALSEQVAHELKQAVPSHQNIAPVQFDVIDGLLSIRAQHSHTAPEDRRNAVSAKDHLINQGSLLLENLESSNCDRRLLEVVRRLNTSLLNDENVIALGLSNIACELMHHQFELELPQAISGMLSAQTIGVNLYVGQFDDWHRFVEKASISQLREEDAPVVAVALSNVLDKLELQPENSNPEVPRTLMMLREAVTDPKKASKRVIFAAWRTLENLFISLFNFGADFFVKTAQKTSDRLSTATARAVVIALMSAALAGATTLAPISARIPDSAWISKAVDIVKRQIEQLD